jgi:hypothetical protein
MLKRKVRLKITTTSRRAFRLDVRATRASCPTCGREVELVTEVEAVGILRVDGPALGQLIAAGRVHTVQVVSDYLWVCKDSLFR